VRSELTEPTLEELSAYIDGELDDAARERVEQHLATCADCRTRVDGLRETAYAVRALPMESPPRSFSLPPQRRATFRWAPVGWLGAAAAAVLVIVVGVHQLYTPGGTTTATSSFAGAGAPAPASKAAGSALAAPLASSRAYDQTTTAGAAAASNQATVTDPTNPAHRLVLGSDAYSYAANGTIRVTILIQGSPTNSTDSTAQGLSLRLMRGTTGVALAGPPGVESYSGAPVFGGYYDLRKLSLPDPRAGDYRLVATWVIPDGSGRVLEASIPIKLTAGG
jgi:hypothetical protein